MLLFYFLLLTTKKNFFLRSCYLVAGIQKLLKKLQCQMKFQRQLKTSGKNDWMLVVSSVRKASFFSCYTKLFVCLSVIFYSFYIVEIM